MYELNFFVYCGSQLSPDGISHERAEIIFYYRQIIYDTLLEQ